MIPDSLGSWLHLSYHDGGHWQWPYLFRPHDNDFGSSCPALAGCAIQLGSWHPGPGLGAEPQAQAGRAADPELPGLQVPCQVGPLARPRQGPLGLAAARPGGRRSIKVKLTQTMRIWNLNQVPPVPQLSAGHGARDFRDTYKPGNGISQRDGRGGRAAWLELEQLNSGLLVT